MRAMLLHEPRPIENAPLILTDLPVPSPVAGEILVRVGVCGVCHTDLHTVEGDLPLPKLPLVPGHEVIGRVEALGEGASRFKVGERIGVPWLHSACGKCRYCRKESENLCENGRFTGYQADGGYAEFMVVGEDFAYRIPEGFSDEEAAPLMCAGVIGYRALRLSDVRPGMRLGLYGFGASAHITIQIAIHMGCTVYVFTRTEEHRRHATELGAAWVGGAADEPPSRLDSSIIFAPAGWIIPEALRALAPGGTCALAGIHMSDVPSMPYDLIYHERTLRSVANATRADAQEFLILAGEIPVKTHVEVYDLADANAVLADLSASKHHGASVLQVSR